MHPILQRPYPQHSQREWNKKYAFSDMQVEYLRTLGVELPPEDERPRYVFAFEREGWE